VPVAPADTVQALRAQVDQLICLATPEPFTSVYFLVFAAVQLPCGVLLDRYRVKTTLHRLRSLRSE
jgi:hypothetical protein